MDLRIELNIECIEQCENLSDEVYLTAGITERGIPAVRARSLWEGRMSCDDAGRCQSGPFLLWQGQVPDGHVVAVLLNLIEQDGLSYAPGVELADRMARRASGLLAQKGEEAASELHRIDYATLLDHECGPAGCLASDQLVGSFIFVLHNRVGGGLDVKIHPILHASMGTDGRLEFSGGGKYRGAVTVNGKRLGG